MKEEIAKLLEEKKQLNERIDKINKAILAFQEVCTHDLEFSGNDSHRNYYDCSICTKKVSE